MNSQYSLPVVHPAFETLKRWARSLHFIAASLILLNAFEQLQTSTGNNLLAYMQMVIAADIYLLVFFGGHILQEAPRLNLIFRLMEALTLAGVGIMLISRGQAGYGFLQLLISGGYFFLFYRERRVVRSEAIDISPTGITLPNFLKDAEIGWYEISNIIPRYHSIIIETFRNKPLQFKLRENLRIEELEQLESFCERHLGRC